LFLVSNFGLRFALSDMSIATSVFFSRFIHLENLFPCFHFNTLSFVAS
jgi:hypothetical protein